MDLEEVLAAVGRHYRMSAGDLAEAGRGDLRRAVAGWLARRSTAATRREISDALGLGHPDSAGNLVRRIERERSRSASSRRDLNQIEQALARHKTQNRA